MIYLMDSNQLVPYNNFNQFNEYEFYKSGCIVSPSKLRQVLRSASGSDFVIGKPRAQPVVQPAHSHEVDQLGSVLQPQEEQIFATNPGIMFEECKRFRYLRMADQGDRLPEKSQTEAKNKFVAQGRDILNCSPEQTDYVIKNWRTVLKEVVGSQ